MKIKKIIWLTDIHLNFLHNLQVDKFIKKVKNENPDVLLIGGDIGEAPDVDLYLDKFNQNIDADIYFVLGNHDFYGGSIYQVRNKVKTLSYNFDRLHYLDNTSYFELSKNTALIGHSCWADGRIGDYWGSNIQLNDYVLIKELTGLDKRQLLEKLNKLGDEAAHHLQNSMDEALKKYENIICLTHIPPFLESCWHKGNISDKNYLPFFSCKVVGDVLRTTMRENPCSYLTVLCGHTHSPGKTKIMDNLEVITGGAEYGNPTIQKTFYVP